MKVRGNAKGFTLIELIIIIIILGILAAVAIPKYLDVRQQAADATLRGVLGGLRGANTVIWANRVINGHTTTYTLGEIVGQMELKGVSSAVDKSGQMMTITVGAVAYSITMDAIGQPPNTVPAISAPGYTTW